MSFLKLSNTDSGGFWITSISPHPKKDWKEPCQIISRNFLGALFFVLKINNEILEKKQISVHSVAKQSKNCFLLQRFDF